LPKPSSHAPALSIKQIRQRVLVALFSDDELMEVLVLKGGNAISMIHGISDRTSIDLDFSIAERFNDAKRMADKIFDSLDREFRSDGLVVFDRTFASKPNAPGKNTPDWWGGYFLTFKLVRRDIFDEYGGNLDLLRRHAESVAPSQQRKFTIDISHNEYCDGKIQSEVDDHIVYAYSLEMIVAEKFRAICQQMEEYEVMGDRRRARARDFFDIHSILSEGKVDLASAETLRLFRSVFAAKHVPLELIDKIIDTRDFHSTDWAQVVQSVGSRIEDFDFYFDSVTKTAKSLEPLWKMQSPF